MKANVNSPCAAIAPWCLALWRASRANCRLRAGPMVALTGLARRPKPSGAEANPCETRTMSFRSRRELLLAGVALLAAPAVLRAAPTQLRIGHGLPATHPVHPAMQHFADIVRERTGGAIEIAIFPDGQI